MRDLLLVPQHPRQQKMLIGARAKMQFPIHPHMLRHGCGYALANAGHDTRALQAWLGHKNIQHTGQVQKLLARLGSRSPDGTAEIVAATSFPNFARENIRYRCNRHKVRGQQVNYKSAEKYIGSDTLELLVLFPGGFAREVHVNIDVR
jgi:hypothetical protein